MCVSVYEHMHVCGCLHVFVLVVVMCECKLCVGVCKYARVCMFVEVCLIFLSM